MHTRADRKIDAAELKSRLYVANVFGTGLARGRFREAGAMTQCFVWDCTEAARVDAWLRGEHESLSAKWGSPVRLILSARFSGWLLARSLRLAEG
jgi:hypothetical protein